MKPYRHFLIFWIFLLFWLNFLLPVGLERNGMTIFNFSLFFFLFQTTLAWNEAIMVFFNFFNSFAIFLVFSITRRIGTEQNDNFYFLSLSSFSNLFWLQMKPQWHFLFFSIFLLFFLEFSITRRVGTEQNGTITFIFSLSYPFPTFFGFKWSHNGIFYFFQFFCYFFGIFYYASGRNEVEI